MKKKNKKPLMATIRDDAYSIYLSACDLNNIEACRWGCTLLGLTDKKFLVNGHYHHRLAGNVVVLDCDSVGLGEITLPVNLITLG